MNQPKQTISKTETNLSHSFLLREAADNYAKDFTKVVIGDVQAHSFKQGANWQSQHSYSEQEVRSMLEALRQICAEEAKIEMVGLDDFEVDRDSILSVQFDDLLK